MKAINSIGLLLWMGLRVLLCIGAPALASEPMDKEPIVSLKWFGTCTACKSYDLSFYRDGASEFIGRDGVRRFGRAGTVRFLSGMDHPDSGYATRYAATIAPVVFRTKHQLHQLLDSFSEPSTLKRLLADADSSQCVPGITDKTMQRLTVSAMLGNQKVDKTVCYSPSVPPHLRSFVEGVETLYEYPKDKLFLPSFLRERDAVVRAGYHVEIPPSGRPHICSDKSLDMVITIHRGGEIYLSGVRSLNHDPTWAYPTVAVRGRETQAAEIVSSILLDARDNKFLQDAPVLQRERVTAGMEGPTTASTLHVKLNNDKIVDLSTYVRTWIGVRVKPSNGIHQLHNLANSLSALLQSELPQTSLEELCLSVPKK